MDEAAARTRACALLRSPSRRSCWNTAAATGPRSALYLMKLMGVRVLLSSAQHTGLQRCICQSCAPLQHDADNEEQVHEGDSRGGCQVRHPVGVEQHLLRACSVGVGEQLRACTSPAADMWQVSNAVLWLCTCLERRGCKHCRQLPQLLCPAAHVRRHALVRVVDLAGQPRKRRGAAVFQMQPRAHRRARTAHTM
jgi:hypothetical protein